MSDRILLVDDEPRLLDGLRRTLRGRYDVETAGSGAEGLEVLAASVAGGTPFAVVVSDMMMPAMNGAEFLTKAREVVPDAVPMILSGQADLTSTIAAVNNANLFRFLTKPCDPDDLTRALDAALRQYQLVRAEKVLLEQTLGGAVDVLTEVLSMASPQASQRTARVRAVVAGTAAALDLADDWRLPLAAMLSHIGCISVPGQVLDKLGTNRTLTDPESTMLHGHPETGQRLIERIPRLDQVAVWIGSQFVDPNGVLETAHTVGTEVEPGADLSPMVLPAVTGFLALVDTGQTPRDAARAMTGAFPDVVIEAVLKAVEDTEPKGVPVELLVRHLAPGMVTNDEIVTTTGMVLVRRGEKLTEVHVARVENFAKSVGIVEPIKMLASN